jgi:hypothetical protein
MKITVSRVLYLAPIAVIAAYGAWWIAAHAGGGRAATHTLWQSLTLTEITVALLLRGRKPAGALAGILAAYLVFDLPWLTLPPMLFALLTVAAVRGHRTVTVAAAAAAAAIMAAPYLHGDRSSFAGYTLPLLAAAGAAVAVGTYLRRARARALLRRSCAAMRFQLDAYRVVRMIIDILDRVRTLGGHPACPRPGRHGVRGRGECQRVAQVIADSRRGVDDHDTGVPVGVLGFAMPRGYGHLKDAHVVIFEEHPV